MRTDDLIAQLAAQAAPMTPLRSPAARAARWLLLALGCGVAGALLFGARADLGQVVGETTFIWWVAGALGTLVLAGSAALVLAIPGSERTPWLRSAAVGVACVWPAAMLATLISGQESAGASDWPVCFARVVAIGLVPAAVLFAMLRRSAPLRTRWTGALAGSGAMAAGALAIAFICPVDDSAHVLLGHFGPVVALAIVAAVSAPRLLDAFALHSQR